MKRTLCLLLLGILTFSSIGCLSINKSSSQENRAREFLEEMQKQQNKKQKQEPYFIYGEKLMVKSSRSISNNSNYFS